MKTILLFGAGRSATVLIDYLLENAISGNWRLVLVDADHALASSKIGPSQRGTPVSFDILDEEERGRQIKSADLVISLLPPGLHIEVAKDCLRYHKSLLTASYVDPQIKALEKDIEKNKLLFLYEMGLDPGIDHMSAMRLFHDIHARNGSVHSFISHCGGLVAPESDDNPWHYKISWNARNIIMAGKAGAHYLENGEEIRVPYESLFSQEKTIEVPGIGELGWYPNRDSMSYIPLYGLKNVNTFIRTTLRHPDFLFGWKNIVDLKLTDESPVYDSANKTLQALFKEHMDLNGFGEWLTKKLSDRFEDTRGMLENLLKLAEAENEARQSGEEVPPSFMTADETGTLQEVEIEQVKNQAASHLAHRMHQANLILKQLFFLGMDDNETRMDKGKCSAADLLQFAAEKKLSLRPYDKDMIIMKHEIEWMLEGQKKIWHSSLVVKGENNLRTAMAKTVGLPLGIAARNILNGKIKLTGLHIPTARDIYEPVLEELELHGVMFREDHFDH